MSSLCYLVGDVQTKCQSPTQGWLQGYVIGGWVKENLTNSCRSMLRFDRLESVNVEV